MELAKESIYWIFRIIIVGIGIFFIIAIIGTMVNYKVDVNNVKSYLVRNKIILDENCLAYKDYRTHLGTIDKNKFKEETIRECLNADMGIVLNLTYKKSDKSIEESISINKNLAEADKRDFCYDEKTFSCIRGEYTLILKDNLKEIPAKLIIDTITLLK